MALSSERDDWIEEGIGFGGTRREVTPRALGAAIDVTEWNQLRLERRHQSPHYIAVSYPRSTFAAL